MSAAAFRIQRLRIEGFKAFTEPQEFEFGGHIFVFGSNGFGKSSVVEAVRWCLFGLAGRPEVEVRNVFYTSGECKVELEMEGPGGRWLIQRRLGPGSSDSVLSVRNPSGDRVRLNEVFPNLARLGPHEGTHVVFASQQSTHRRPQADITDFDKVLYSYLRIEDVPDLLRRLETEIEDQKQIGKQLAEKLEDAEKSLRAELKEVDDRTEDVLKYPPWPGATVPTDAETDERIYTFVSECGGSLEPSDGRSATREWLLREAERAIKHMSDTEVGEWQRWLDLEQTELQQLKKAIEKFEELSEEFEAAVGRVEASKLALREALGNTTKQILREKRNELERQGNQWEQYQALAHQASGYIQEFSPEQCPVCDMCVNPEAVLSVLEDRIGSDGSAFESSDALTCVEKRLKAIEVAEEDLKEARTGLGSTESAMASSRKQLQELLDDPEDLSSGKRKVEHLRDHVDELERELRQSGNLVNSRERVLQDLRREARFQEHRARTGRLQHKLESALEPAREAYRDFEEVLTTLYVIREALQESFNSTLNKTLPEISALMTEVYGRLTQQTSFPEIVVDPGPPHERRRLSVGVTSEHTAGEYFDPAEVLNGQALNALNLVPYFVFSQFHSEALELDCLLIDDPSQSFDTSRVELLMRELATAATHAQLIVASHEEDRFRPLVDTYFDARSYRVLRVTSFSRTEGQG